MMLKTQHFLSLKKEVPASKARAAHAYEQQQALAQNGTFTGTVFSGVDLDPKAPESKKSDIKSIVINKEKPEHPRLASMYMPYALQCKPYLLNYSPY